MKITPQLIAVVFVFMVLGCTSQKERSHFFLDEYPELIFTDTNLTPLPSNFFIEPSFQNGMYTYEIKDHSLVLRYRKSGAPYSGYIRTYHWGINNIEAVFEEGKIHRFRYWHPNRVLGMDMNYITGIGNAWNQYGELSITWNDEETQFRNLSSKNIKQLMNDTSTYYFNYEGELTYYSIRRDTAFLQYYANGSPRFKFPLHKDGLRQGVVKRWHPNGKLQAIGQYQNGKEIGIWIEYDSLGDEVNRIFYK